MKPRRSTLANGLTVVTANMPGTYSATVSVFVGVGSRYEAYPEESGVSHFLEHLLFKGTKQRPTTKIISEQIDAVGGWNNAYTSAELTNYYIKVPFEHTELALDILSDMLQHSLLDPDEIDRERGVVIEEMNVYRDDPASYVHRLTPSLLWPGHPLSRDVLGEEAVIREIPRATIAAYLKRHYQPRNLVVVVAGRVDHEAVLKQVEQLFGRMKGEAPERPKRPAAKLAPERVSALVKDTAQVHLAIATPSYSYRHPNDAAAGVITTILGRGLSSRLFTNVRERKGLAYSIGAADENYVDAGEFEIYAGVNRAKQAEAITAIIEELRLIATRRVTKSELSKAKNQIRGSLMMSMESSGAVADRFGTQQVLLGKTRTVEQTLADVDAVTPADVLRVAAEMLAPERLRLGIISPDPESAVATFTSLTDN